MERTVGGTIPTTDEIYSRHLRMVNGGVLPPRSDNIHTSVSTGVPKMGVRARVADWPPRKDTTGVTWHVNPEAENTIVPSVGKNHIKLGSVMSPQDSSMLRNIHNTLRNRTQAMSNNYSTDTRYPNPGDYRSSVQRNPRNKRIRQRSNSDMTISEMEAPGDSGDDWAPQLGGKCSPLHREYGSTSSIDQHGVSGESFFEILKGYQGDKVDQRSPAPDKLEDMLNVGPKHAGGDLQDSVLDNQPPKVKDKPPKRRTKSETGGESIFRKLRHVRGESDSPRAGFDSDEGRADDVGPPPKPWVCQKGFAHYDVQSLLFDLNEVAHLRQVAVKRKNTTTGASAAAAVASATSTLSSTHSLPYSSPSGSQEELSSRSSPVLDGSDEQSNEMLLSCPCFRNEIGTDINGRGRSGGGYHAFMGGGAGNGNTGTLGGEGSIYELSVNTHCTNAGVAVLEGPKDGLSTLSEKGKQYIVEHVDLGASYYRKFFYLRGKFDQHLVKISLNFTDLIYFVPRRTLELLWDRRGAGAGGGEPAQGEARGGQRARPAVQLPPHLQNQ